MKKVALVFTVALAFGATAVASEIAISTQAGWFGQGAADQEMQEIVDNVTAVPIEVFTATDHAALADWVVAHTGNGSVDLLILCGQFPDTIYEPGNAQADDSLAELFLDDGNCIVNTGDYMFYVVNGAGTNGEGGIRTMMDIPGITMWDDDTSVVVTAEGQEFTPTLEDFASDRPFHLNELEGAWEAELILAQNGDGTRADPVIVRNTETGGRLGIFYQTAGQDGDPRGEVMSEWINNWFIPNVAAANPLARSPAPKEGEMITQTAVTLQWKPGDFAAVHDVYLGDSLEAVEAATRDDTDVFLGTLSSEMVRVGLAGDPRPEPLVPGQTYYWRVDEVNDANTASPWKGNVWSFWVQPLTAYNPTPSDGVPFVLLDPDLAWQPGMNVLFHTIFFGESYEEVDNMMVGWMKAETTIAPANPQLFGPLQPATTYYWRVDEFAMTGVTTKGDIWSFTTVPEVAVTDPDLVGWWTLDEGVGNTAVDWSGHGNHGVLFAGAQWTDGYYGGALMLDGNDDYVDCGNDPSLNLTSSVTVAAWVKLDGSVSDSKIGSNQDGSTGGYKLGVYGNLAEFEIRTAGNQAFLNRAVTGGTILQPDVWYHITGVYSPGQYIRTYINGELDRELVTTEILGSSRGTFKIGRESFSSAYFWPGTIDDLRVYDVALTETEIAEVMRGNPLLAGSPSPGPGAVVDIRDAAMLSWVAGDTAASHDVYFGTDRAAVVAADNSAPEFQGNQPGVSFSLAALVELGGEYFWRIDEVEAAGTVQTGYTWRFTIPDYLIVEDFESYTNEVGSRVFEKWIDGVGFTQPVNTPGNGTGALVGHDIWTPGTTFTTIVETANVHGGGQAMPIYYDNTFTPLRSEVDHTFAPAQNWTIEGVTTLVIHFRGQAGNTGDLYVEINGVKVPYDGDPADITSNRWIAWEIDLASVGTNLTNVLTLTIGIEGGQSGLLFVDDILLTRP